jgi:hypothetical protein
MIAGKDDRRMGIASCEGSRAHERRNDLDVARQSALGEVTARGGHRFLRIAFRGSRPRDGALGMSDGVDGRELSTGNDDRATRRIGASRGRERAERGGEPLRVTRDFARQDVAAFEPSPCPVASA